MYADDTHITCATVVNLTQSNLNHDLDNLNKRFISNKLTLDSAKLTEFMRIGSIEKLSTLSNPLELSIDNVPIKHAFPVKSLGIFIDENQRPVANTLINYLKRSLPG